MALTNGNRELTREKVRPKGALLPYSMLLKEQRLQYYLSLGVSTTRPPNSDVSPLVFAPLVKQVRGPRSVPLGHEILDGIDDAVVAGCRKSRVVSGSSQYCAVPGAETAPGSVARGPFPRPRRCQELAVVHGLNH